MKIFSQLKTIINLMSKITTLKKENKDLEDTIAKLQTKLNRLSVKDIVQREFDNGLKWYDYTLLSPEEQKAHYDEAQFFIGSKTITNTKNYLEAQLVKKSVIDYAKKDNKVRDAQMMITGINLFFEELEEITNPFDLLKKEKTAN